MSQYTQDRPQPGEVWRHKEAVAYNHDSRFCAKAERLTGVSKTCWKNLQKNFTKWSEYA